MEILHGQIDSSSHIFGGFVVVVAVQLGYHEHIKGSAVELNFKFLK